MLAHRVVRQHGSLIALVSGPVVLAVVLLQGVLTILLAQLTYVGTGAPGQGLWWAGYARQFGMESVPLAVGVLLSLWFIAPIGARTCILPI